MRPLSRSAKLQKQRARFTGSTYGETTSNILLPLRLSPQAFESRVYPQPPNLSRLLRLRREFQILVGKHEHGAEVQVFRSAASNRLAQQRAGNRLQSLTGTGTRLQVSGSCGDCHFICLRG